MQKVEGSSPFIRFREQALATGRFRCPGSVARGSDSAGPSPGPRTGSAAYGSTVNVNIIPLS